MLVVGYANPCVEVDHDCGSIRAEAVCGRVLCWAWNAEAVWLMVFIFDANRIVKSTGQNDTANNAINALRATGMFPGGIKVNHYLTDTDADMGGFQCVPGFHRNLEAWIAEQPADRNPRIPDLSLLPPGRQVTPTSWHSTWAARRR